MCGCIITPVTKVVCFCFWSAFLFLALSNGQFSLEFLNTHRAATWAFGLLIPSPESTWSQCLLTAFCPWIPLLRLGACSHSDFLYFFLLTASHMLILNLHHPLILSPPPPYPTNPLFPANPPPTLMPFPPLSLIILDCMTMAQQFLLENGQLISG